MALMSTTGESDSDYDAAVASGNILNVFAVLEKENGLPAGYLAKTAKVESGMNPNAQNPRSSAGGLFQFINSTAKQYGLTDKMDPVASSLAAAQLAGDNKAFLADRLGREPNDVELYAAHQQGPAGAAKIIANPGAPMASLVGSEAARLNAASGITGGQFIDRFAKKFGSSSVAGGRGISTEPTPEADMPAADAVPTSGFKTGAMANPYTPEEEGWNVPVGNTISAIGQALLSGSRQSPLSNLPQIMASQKALADKREDRRYGMYRDNRDFGFRESEAARAQANTDRSNTLQTEQLGLSRSNIEADNRRQDAQASAPKIMTDASGAVLAVKPDGTSVSTLVPGQKAITLGAQMDERRAAAKAAGLQEGTPAFTTFLLTGKMANEDKATLSAGDKQAIFKAEDALPGLDQTIGTLQRAKELNPQTYTGTTARVLGKVGTSIPGAGMFLDEKKANATREFGQIMSMEAIQSMSQTLKGATTDAEMSRFMEILGDPSTPPEIRGRTIDRLATLGQRQKELAESRVKDLRGGDYFKKDRGPAAAATAAPGASTSPSPAVGPSRAELEAEARRRGLIQ